MKIHFIGIGGIGVSALAQYYLARGHQVNGSDLNASEITDLLQKKGAQIYIGKHTKKRLTYDVRQVVYSPAVPKDNPELQAAQEQGIKCQTYPEALGELTKQYFTIAVSGTHGKSTTSSMLALILTKAGLDPTVVLGTKLKEFDNSNFRMGKGKYLVIEADEWQASFLNFWPQVIVLTNIEEEHLDYYKDLEHILRTYKEYVEHLSKDGVLVMNGEDKNIGRVLKSKCQMSNVKSSPNVKCQKFSTQQIEAEKLRGLLKIPGEHNVANALAGLAVARALEVPDEVSFKALSEYKGSWRRFEEKKVIIDNLSIIIISDYGHHPTEVLATLKAVREKYAQKKIWCVFQPHQYQRTFYLFDEFVKAFKQAPVDELILTDIFDVAGRENQEIREKVSAQKLIEAIGKGIYLPKSEIISHLKKNLQGGEVVVIMGAGDVYKLVEEFSTGGD